MNTIRNAFAVELPRLRELLHMTYHAIQMYQNQHNTQLEQAMRDAMLAVLPIIRPFKAHIPAYKAKYIDVLERQEQLPARDLIICFDRAIHELHVHSASGKWAQQPWSKELRDILNARIEAAPPKRHFR